MATRRWHSRRPISAYRRYEIGFGLLHQYGFVIRQPSRPPFGYFQFPGSWHGHWRLRGQVPDWDATYVELTEDVDTRQSYPLPAGNYEYLVHLDRSEGGRNVSFHRDLTKPTDLLYHWHDYPDGFARSVPVPILVPISLLWILEAAWLLIGNPYLTVPQLLATIPPSGPPDPW